MRPPEARRCQPSPTFPSDGEGDGDGWLEGDGEGASLDPGDGEVVGVVVTGAGDGTGLVVAVAVGLAAAAAAAAGATEAWCDGLCFGTAGTAARTGTAVSAAGGDGVVNAGVTGLLGP